MEKLAPVFDAEKFIREIQDRPAIWDATSTDYSNKQKKVEAWMEICRISKENFEQLSSKEKKDIGRDLQRKWKNIRLAYVRVKRRTITSSGSAGGRRPKYDYWDMLSFLDPVIEHKSTSSNAPPDGETESRHEEESIHDSDGNEESSLARRPRKKQKMRSTAYPSQQQLSDINKLVTKRGMHQRESILQADEEQLFLLSLAKDLKSIPEDRRLQAKCEILSVIAKYKAQVVFTPYSQDLPQHFYVPSQASFQQYQASSSHQVLRSFQPPRSCQTPSDTYSLSSDRRTPSDSSMIDLFP